jgi:hypothetical protein
MRRRDTLAAHHPEGAAQMPKTTPPGQVVLEHGTFQASVVPDVLDSHDLDYRARLQVNELYGIVASAAIHDGWVHPQVLTRDVDAQQELRVITRTASSKAMGGHAFSSATTTSASSSRTPGAASGARAGSPPCPTTSGSSRGTTTSVLLRILGTTTVEPGNSYTPSPASGADTPGEEPGNRTIDAMEREGWSR